MSLIWNVYRENINNKEMEVFNIFEHGCFYNEIVKLLERKDIIRQEFEERLKSEAMYYFWGKCQYEIVITAFPVFISNEEFKRLSKEAGSRVVYVNPETCKKIDIYDQLKLNWNSFSDYVWSFKQ